MLQVNIFLSLGGHRLIKEFRVVLNNGDYLLEVIIVKRLKMSLHTSDLRAVGLDQLFVVFQGTLGIGQLVLQQLYIALNVKLVGLSGAGLNIIGDKRLVTLTVPVGCRSDRLHFLYLINNYNYIYFIYLFYINF